MADKVYLPITSINGKTCISLRNKFGKVAPFQLGIWATSGHGKGLFQEAIIEQWQKSTSGIVIILADPKEEAEFSYAMYKAIERYHTERLKSDGCEPISHSCKLYHPHTFNIPKSRLPNINFFTLPLKEMGRDEWSILVESSADNEAIKLLMRVSESLGRHEGLVDFLLEVEHSVEGKTKGKRKARDPKNFGLRHGSGTAKSITEIAGLMHPFKKNYFLRKQTCPNRLDWKSVLTDNENYHVFLSMWLKDDKLKEFMVLTLLKQLMKNIHYAKRPILLVIPEVLRLCPRNAQGYKFFLSQALADELITSRSKGRSVSFIVDGQSWGMADDKIKSATSQTIFGGLNSKDCEMVCKSNNYKREIRERLQGMPINHYIKYGDEDYGCFRGFFPRHMHKEPHYNWLEMYHRFFPSEEKRYNELTEYMRKELREEEQKIRDLIRKEDDEEREDAQKKREEKAAPKDEEKKFDSKKEADEKSKELIMKLVYEVKNDSTLEKKEKTWRAIGRKFELSHITAQKYYELHEKMINDTELAQEENVGKMVGEGVMPEEVGIVKGTDRGTDENVDENVDADDAKNVESGEENGMAEFEKAVSDSGY